jgi:IS30 family transposase
MLQMRKYRKRAHFSEAEKIMMCDRWQQGNSLHTIARLLDTSHTSVRRNLVLTGGIRPPRRTRSSLALSLAEREEISRGIVAGHSIRSIAAALRRAPSTVSRELRQNGGRQQYRASSAEQAAWQRAHRPKQGKLVVNRALTRVVARQLKRRWSPEQIAGWLKRTYPDDENYQVSHETIYRSLFIQARGALKKELLQYLRTQRSMRQSRHKSLKGEGLGQITDTVSIRERPAEVEDRAVPGHWEGDLLFGSRNNQIATLVERHSRYVMLAKVDGKDSRTVIDALIRQASILPRELYRPLTRDRGSEMAEHPRFTLATDIQVYFCDPQSPWQRGSNENTNRLLRQYFPKGMDLSGYSQVQLNAVARQLNERPRKTLDYETPAERFNQCVASIG